MNSPLLISCDHDLVEINFHKFVFRWQALSMHIIIVRNQFREIVHKFCSIPFRELETASFS